MSPVKLYTNATSFACKKNKFRWVR